jgi:predicted neuraminidase
MAPPMARCSAVAVSRTLAVAALAASAASAAPLPFDGLVRPQAGGLAVAYMDPPNLANHASTIELLPDGTLLLAWFSGIEEEADKCAIAVSRLPPGSAQWTPPAIVSERDGYSNQNPVLFHDATSGSTMLFHSQLPAKAGEGLDALWLLLSSDGGATWSPPSPFLNLTAQQQGVFDRNRVVPRADGSLLLPLYWTSDGAPNSPFMLISDAANHSRWGAPVNVTRAADLVQPTVVRTAPGTLTAFFRDRRARNIYGAASSDEGLTWTAPTVAAAGGLNNNNAGIEAFQLASGATILLFNNATKGRTPLTAALSTTAGASWTASRDLQVHDDNSTNTEGVEYSYPTVLQSPDGAIHAAFTYNRQTIKYVRFTEGWIRGDRE